MQASKKNKKATSMAKCEFCSKEFKSERTIAAHLCVKKKRFAEKDTVGSRLGFRVFQRFYELTTSSKTPKSFREFIDSKFYIDFVKFGRHLIDINPINTDEYIDFIIKNAIPLSDWKKDYVYVRYLKEYTQKEPAQKALERTIIEMGTWCTENNVDIVDFFEKVNTVEAVYLIKSGKLSPWVLYLASSSDKLWVRINEEQEKFIQTAVDFDWWQKKFIANKDDVDFIVSVLTEAKL
ncbi:hypothetical protein MIJ3_00060 [Pseudomonas phage vB_PaeM_MIJ3]|uniref:Uncharacterized protein n=1 Tax=Pseudomonas phage vB_PaeM_PA5oct TaxID=2163605 RepID=A0A4Y5JUH8_9CAUD|nr:hypothetical protein PQE65_gp265 [Pseudomonas phage vB_PaeM_PA5oct]QCG76100.1 hypothetical protein EST35_0219 [Pseudomonas phage vB_PaeM_PA5oct]WMI31763.1 hypothetical protein GBBBJNDB_00060 [Pseudomonas phage Callisto]VOH53815.1 hypothetical protein MIJ3_00060 [Pseudomonas phage vB_PaeM_MIJ3]